MARILQPSDAVRPTPFKEPTFDLPAGPAQAALSLDAELVTPEDELRRAQEEAAAIVAQAQEEAEQIRAEAKKEGRVAGELVGKREALEQHREAANTLAALVGAVRAEQIKNEVDLTRYVTEVALAIVHRLLGDLVDAHPEVMRHVVSRAIAALSRRAAVVVRVHPSLVDVVERQRETLLRIYEDVAELKIVGDDTIAAGGCVLDAEAVTLDATVDAVITRLRAGMLQDLDPPPAAPDPAPQLRPNTETPDTPEPEETVPDA